MKIWNETTGAKVKEKIHFNTCWFASADRLWKASSLLSAFWYQMFNKYEHLVFGIKLVRDSYAPRVDIISLLEFPCICLLADSSFWNKQTIKYVNYPHWWCLETTLAPKIFTIRVKTKNIAEFGYMCEILINDKTK